MNVLRMSSLLVLSLSLMAGCHSNRSDSPTVATTIHANVTESHEEQVPIAIHSTGTVRAKETAVLSAQVTGRIVQVLVREGDRVQAGQTLVVLDEAMQKSAVAQAAAAWKATQQQQSAAQTDAQLAASTLERYQKLKSQRSVNLQEMDEVTRRSESASAKLESMQAQGEAAHAQLISAQTMLGYTRLRAPFSGVVTARLADPGTMASPGLPLLQVDSSGPLQLNTTVDESAIAVLRKGMKTRVTIDGAASAENEGTVAEILPAADSASHSFLVKIDLPVSGNLHAGVYGSAEFTTGTRKVVLIPRSAVILRGSLTCAYAIDGNGIAQLRYVTLGANYGSNVEVLTGISAGEHLVDLPADRDLSGKVIEEKP